MWYMMLGIGWLIYAMIYGMIWCIKKVFWRQQHMNGNKEENKKRERVNFENNEEEMNLMNSNQNNRENRSFGKRGNIPRWIIGGVFAMFTLVNGFHYSSIFLLISSILMMPIAPIEKILQKIKIKPVVAIVLSSIMFFVGVMLSPSESLSEDNVDEISCEESSMESLEESSSSKLPQSESSSHVSKNESSEKESIVSSTTSKESEISAVTPELPKESKSYIITFSARIMNNNSVGNEWSKGAKFDNNEISSGDTISAELSKGPVIIVFASEADKSADDYGSKTVEFSNILIGEEETKIVTVTVIENDGRYSGNSAQWEFTITCKRVA